VLWVARQHLHLNRDLEINGADRALDKVCVLRQPQAQKPQGLFLYQFAYFKLLAFPLEFLFHFISDCILLSLPHRHLFHCGELLLGDLLLCGRLVLTSLAILLHSVVKHLLSIQINFSLDIVGFFNFMP